MLGNVLWDDGGNFKGRGMKQLTGRANYAEYWEKVNAILLRWHVFRPANVATTTADNSYVAQTIREVIANNPTLRWDNPVAQWTDEQERRLTEAILTKANAVAGSNNPTFQNAAQWPTYTGRNGRGYTINNQLGSLRTTRNSFTLNTTGI
jgi:hypothetical protein